MAGLLVKGFGHKSKKISSRISDHKYITASPCVPPGRLRHLTSIVSRSARPAFPKISTVIRPVQPACIFDNFAGLVYRENFLRPEIA
jgi:hypothetical protein